MSVESTEIVHDRRRQDKVDMDASFTMCPAFLNHSDIKIIHQDLTQIKRTVDEMHDIVVAWQDAKSFFKIIKVIGEILKWVVAVGVAVGIIWYFVTGKDKK